MADPTTKRCPYCAEEIQAAAIVCRFCNRQVAPGVVPTMPAATPQVIVAQVQPSRGIAAVLSLLLPGLGQLYKGQLGAGLAFLIFTFVGYVAFIAPGLLLHFICILHAASDNSPKPVTRPTIQCSQCGHIAYNNGQPKCDSCGHVYFSKSVKCVDCGHVTLRGPSACPQCGHVYVFHESAVQGPS